MLANSGTFGQFLRPGAQFGSIRVNCEQFALIVSNSINSDQGCAASRNPTVLDPSEPSEPLRRPPSPPSMQPPSVLVRWQCSRSVRSDGRGRLGAFSTSRGISPNIREDAEHFESGESIRRLWRAFTVSTDLARSSRPAPLLALPYYPPGFP